MSNIELGVKDQVWRGELPARFEPGWAERIIPAGLGLALALVDVLLVLGAFLLAYWVRFVVSDMEAAALDLLAYARIGLSVGVVVALLFAPQGLYDESRPMAWPARLYAIVSALSTALVVTLVASFLFGGDGFSRLWFAAGWAFAVLLLVTWHALAQNVFAIVRTALARTTRVLIVGANPLGQELARELSARHEVLGYVDNGTDLKGDSDLPLLGPISRLDQIVHTHAVDELVVALPAHRQEQVSAVIARGFRRNVTIKLLPDMGELLPQRFEVQRAGGRSYIGFVPVARVSWLKRAIDLVLGSLVLGMLSPLLLAVAATIKLDSLGPVFYRQRRVGKDGDEFMMFKFRSMHQDAERLIEQLRDQNEATGPLFKMRADPRVTRVGRVLRRLSLDELPQLFNVLRGEMSLVGPRPPVPSEVDQYEDWQKGRLRAVPGMTGLWQVSGRSEVPFHDMVRLDLHYIRNWTLGLDLEILLRTVPAVLTNRGAY